MKYRKRPGATRVHTYTPPEGGKEDRMTVKIHFDDARTPQEVEVFCRCGETLCDNTTANGPVLTMEPCQECLDSMEQDRWERDKYPEVDGFYLVAYLTRTPWPPFLPSSRPEVTEMAFSGGEWPGADRLGVTVLAWREMPTITL